VASVTAAWPPGLAARPYKVKVLNGDTAGRELVLTKVVTTLGRPGVLLTAITRRPSGWVITHVEGQGRAKVNGVDMPGQTLPLREGDVIELAGTQMQFLSG
jgi:hypothetical protein